MTVSLSQFFLSPSHLVNSFGAQFMERTENITAAVRPRRSWRVSFGGGLWESVRIALSSLRANKLRTVLTMLGIIIGVASVVALMAIGNGAQAAITGQIAGIGSNLLTIFPGQRRGPGPGANAPSQNLTLADAEALTKPGALRDAVTIAPIFQGSAQIVAGSNNIQSAVVGVTPNYFTVRNLAAARGHRAGQQCRRRSIWPSESGRADDSHPRANLPGDRYARGEGRRRLRFGRRSTVRAAWRSAAEAIRRAQ